MSWKICKGQKILNVPVWKYDKIECVSNFYEGDILPEDYIVPKSYIDCGIVETTQEEHKKVEKKYKLRSDEYEQNT